MLFLFGLSDSRGVVARIHVSPLPLLLGCGLLLGAGLLTRRMTQRFVPRPHVVDTGDIGREAALVALVLTMLGAVALIGVGLFEYS
jgi:hypothetical protein